MINNLVGIAIDNKFFDLESLISLKLKIIEYIDFHFSDEEKIMTESQIDQRHIDVHKKAHLMFSNEVLDLTADINSFTRDQSQDLADYLIKWLAYHILNIDKSLARQILNIRKGKSPSEAYEIESEYIESNTEPLLKALRSLFFMVSEKNRELKQLNTELEHRIRQRTAELEEANKQLNILATQDDLTGLPNRRFALLSLTQLFSERDRYKSPFAVLMIDADKFKIVNDTFGHDQGDIVIKNVGTHLKNSVRESDVVCRLGGDEFLIICPHCTKEGAHTIGAKILNTSRPIKTADGIECWNGSLSVGIAEATPDVKDPEDLIKFADEAMYKSKSKGGSAIS